MLRLSIVVLCFACWSWPANSLGATPLDDFIRVAAESHGVPGEQAARFLVDNMPASDRDSLSAGFLTENLDLAFRARAEFPWATTVPEELFLNDVLPYAVFDEARDPWRAELYPHVRELVKHAASASDAAQALNREVFKVVNVHYNTGRRIPNQSLKESKELGVASCTGLAIILVNACRTAGIPARAAGTPMWTNNRGNHTWVEIWDGDWHFMGADEYDAAGLDRGWFVEDAAQARADEAQYAIYATTWRRSGTAFPLAWAPESNAVAAVNVTGRYARGTAPRDAARDVASDVARGMIAQLGVRLWDSRGGIRLEAEVRVLDIAGHNSASGRTRAGTADLNDVARFDLPAGIKGTLSFQRGDEVRQIPFEPLDPGGTTIDAIWDEMKIAP